MSSISAYIRLSSIYTLRFWFVYLGLLFGESRRVYGPPYTLGIIPDKFSCQENN